MVLFLGKEKLFFLVKRDAFIQQTKYIFMRFYIQKFSEIIPYVSINICGNIRTNPENCLKYLFLFSAENFVYFIV